MAEKLLHLCLFYKNRIIMHSYSLFGMHIFENAQTAKNIKIMVYLFSNRIKIQEYFPKLYTVLKT